MGSNIQNFFRNKTVFITGGTGFVGKVFIEKLLRTTEVKCVYLLIRPKVASSIEERMNQILNGPLFKRLLAIRPNPATYIKPISGDCTLPGLGISNEDRKELIENVNVVIHSAATVRFNEPLSNAVEINVEATRDMLKLAKEIKHLESYVHVSSAFANCLAIDSEEKFYTEHIGTTSDELVAVKHELGNEKFNEMEEKLVGKFPNTYCYTKSVAEEAVLSLGHGLPICIFRPGMILGASEDPIPGWVDNLYGPISIVYGCSAGVLRVMHASPKQNAAFVPVDYCANMMIACATQTARAFEKKPITEPAIYTLVPDPTNFLNWGTFRELCWNSFAQMPIPNLIWYPMFLFAENAITHFFMILFYHIIPGYFLDLLLLIMGKKPRLTKTYKKIHKQCNLLRYFLDHDFTFDTSNAKKLFQDMTPEDRKLYKFDMATLNWEEYFLDNARGIRRFLAKADESTIPRAKKMFLMFRFLNYLVHGLVFASIGWLLLSLLKFVPIFS